MDWLDDSAAISLGTLGQEKRMSPLTVAILNTTPEQRKPRRSYHWVCVNAAGLILVALIYMGVL